ncbi:hypothetical protein IT087_03105 [Candidatus Uhrbacteria bacterium]|nr:hypothetical protein [Candidatus Uhrbacteria bacterium]
MTKRTLSGFLGLLLIPDHNTVRIMKDVVLEHRRLKRRLASAAYVVKPEGAHITLFQARTFKSLPISTAREVVKTISSLLVTNRAGSAMLHLNKVEPYRGNDKFLFWQARRSGMLDFAHGMAAGLSGWVDKSGVESDSALERRISDLPSRPQEFARAIHHNEQLYGYGLVDNLFEPHITLAADPGGFGKLRPFEEAVIGSVARVVLARMGEWGKIDEILF